MQLAWKPPMDIPNLVLFTSRIYYLETHVASVAKNQLTVWAGPTIECRWSVTLSALINKSLCEIQFWIYGMSGTHLGQLWPLEASRALQGSEFHSLSMVKVQIQYRQLATKQYAKLLTCSGLSSFTASPQRTWFLSFKPLKTFCLPFSQMCPPLSFQPSIPGTI